METKEKNKITPLRLWRLYPLRHVTLLVSAAWIAVYFATRNNREWMAFLCRTLVRPWHSFAGRITSLVPFSVAEWVIALWVALGIGFVVRIVQIFHRRTNLLAAYPVFITAAALVSCLFGLFCLWWGVLYYSGTFAQAAGLADRAISQEELSAATRYYADLAEAYAPQVPRDADGCFTADRTALFDHSEVLYHRMEEKFPVLSGPDLRAKPVLLSRGLSYLTTTGFFFAFTAEANLNVDCPMALLPATIGHELAHQRGVAREDEANFVGIRACMEDGDPVFAYSGALMAYVYLGNALHDTDYDAWLEIAEALSPPIQRDLAVHNAYWDLFEEKPVSEVSDGIYEAFLETYGDDRGMKSYDACVDLLTVYYLETEGK